jgi:hypothetical protein
MKPFRPFSPFFGRLFLFCALVFTLAATSQAQHSIARIWNEEILAAIRIDRPNPPVHARNLFHLATGMYDAWAAYDTVAIGYIHHERQTTPDLATARHEAISYAAYRILKARYINSANAGTTSAALDARLLALGYSPAITTTVGNTPAALGNRIAADLLAWGLGDESNQAGSYYDNTYPYTNPAMVVLSGRTNDVITGGIPAATDPNRWQPLAFSTAFTQNGLASERVQLFVGPTWLHTTPFSLTRTNPTLPWIMPGEPSRFGTATDAAYKQGALEILRASAQLNSPTPIDISPGLGGQGNNLLGQDGGPGHALNPVTGLPYAPQIVSRGDFTRVLAEYWADGPDSETPPGHWHVIANRLADDPRVEKRLGGSGPVLNALEWDVKTYFALSAATHDAACAAWSLKRYYDGTRPITMIRYLALIGQSSAPHLPFYNPAGLPLEPGVVESITPETAAVGGRHENLGDLGTLLVYSWPGEPADRSTQTSAVRWMKASDWVPYQRKSFNTPAFPGYVSGHSTFSRAAAEVLTKLTGSPFFPGGLATFTANENSYLVFERGPTATVTLQWATYFDAADQAGQSRRYGGIHVPEDDYAGRSVGAQVGLTAWSLATQYWDGTVLQATAPPSLTVLAGNQTQLQFPTKRGLYYRIQRSTDLTHWQSITNSERTYGTETIWNGPTLNQPRDFYRVEQSPVPAP